MLRRKAECCFPLLRISYGLNFTLPPPETKKFVDLLFKTLETQVYDIPTTSTTTAIPHATPIDVAPAITSEPAPAKMSVTKQPGEPFLSESLNAANPPSNQPLPGHQVSVYVQFCIAI
jgi:hypothetical protein